MNEDVGRVPAEPGSSSLRSPEPVCAVSAHPGDDPSRGEWPEVEWEAGYPLAEDDDFAAWDSLPLDFRMAAAFLLAELPRAAENCVASCEVQDVFNVDIKRPCKAIWFSTGGWSGAESLLGFIEGRFDTRHFMKSWHRGGHYEFEIPETFYAPRDRDRDPEGDETPKIGSVGGADRARAEGIAQPPPL